MESTRAFRIKAVLPMAIQRSYGSLPDLFVRPKNRMTERARLAVARISNRRELDVKEAFKGIVDALHQLEQEFNNLRCTYELSKMGIALEPKLVSIGGDGIVLEHSDSWPEGTQVNVYVSLSVADFAHILSFSAQTKLDRNGQKTTIFFEESMDPEQQDLIYAFLFQQQGKERRRVLDATDMD
jgi:hypothetical protein